MIAGSDHSLSKIPFASLSSIHHDAVTAPHPESPSPPRLHLCEDKQPGLTDTEAFDIATRFEAIYDANARITSTSHLTSIFSANIYHIDESYGAPTVGIQALFDDLTAPGNYTTTDAVVSVLFDIHSCDQIAVRWKKIAVTRGCKS